MSNPQNQVMIRMTDVRKDFVVNQSGIASIKTLLLWWSKRTSLKLNVLRGISFEVSKGECVAIIEMALQFDDERMVDGMLNYALGPV